MLQKIMLYQKQHGFINTLKWLGRGFQYKCHCFLGKRTNGVYTMNAYEKKEIVLKENNVYLFALNPYCFKNSSSHFSHLARTLNQMGYSVHYIYKNKVAPIFVKNMPLTDHVEISSFTISDFSSHLNVQNVQNFVIFEVEDELFNLYNKLALEKKVTVIQNFSSLMGNDSNFRVEMVNQLFLQEETISRFYNNISIIILNYNNKGVIEKCIDSITKLGNKYHFEIIVVDNQSKDGSYELLEEKYKDIILLKNDRNGCSSGRNLAVRNASKEYLLFLDSDQWVLHSDFLKPYLSIWEKERNIGAIGWAAGWFDKNGYAYYTVDSFPYRYMPPVGLYRKDIGYLGAGGLFMEKKLFEKVGGFDEAYDPTCYEDTDISLKIRNMGLDLIYCPYLGVGHNAHQTTKSGTSTHDKLLKEKGNYFIAKWKKINYKLLKYTK